MKILFITVMRVGELRTARVMLYRGGLNETFRLTVGEAQTMGAHGGKGTRW